MGYLVITGGVAAAVWLVRFALAILRVNPIEASKSAARTRTWRDALFGQARLQDDWLPDARVQGGMVFNPQYNRIEICGRLSDDSLRHTFR